MEIQYIKAWIIIKFVSTYTFLSEEYKAPKCSLCFGLFNKLRILSSLSSFLDSDNSGILDPARIVKAGSDSFPWDLIADGDVENPVSSLVGTPIFWV